MGGGTQNSCPNGHPGAAQPEAAVNLFSPPLVWKEGQQVLCIKRRREQRGGNRKEVQRIGEGQVCLQISSSNISSMIF